MKRMITALLMVFALIGFVGLPGVQAATMDTNGPGSFGTSFFGEDLAQNSPTDVLSPDRDMPREHHIGEGERWSPYPPYYRSEF